MSGVSNPRVWAHGLAAAAISGASSTAGGAIGAAVAGLDIWSLMFWKVVGGAAIGGALVSIIGYLKQSPLWEFQAQKAYAKESQTGG